MFTACGSEDVAGLAAFGGLEVAVGVGEGEGAGEGGEGGSGLHFGWEWWLFFSVGFKGMREHQCS